MKMGKTRLGLLALGLLSLAACAIKNGSTDSEGGDGVVVSVTDTSKVSLNFDDVKKTVFRDSGEFDLNTLRSKLSDKDIALGTVKIIGLAVTYDSSTKAFLTANSGIKFILRIYIKDLADTSAPKLTLETFVDHAKASKLDPAQTLFELNKHLFGKEEGMPFLLASIQNTAVSKVRVIAELTLLDPLKAPGDLNLNMVVDVAGQL